MLGITLPAKEGSLSVTLDKCYTVYPFNEF